MAEASLGSQIADVFEHPESPKSTTTITLTRWGKQFGIAFLVCTFTCLTMLFTPAVQAFAPSSSLVFTSADIWWVSAVFNGVFALVFALLISLAPSRAFARIALFILCLGVAAFVQTTFLNDGMMATNGGYIGWNEWYFVRRMIASGIIWLAILVIPQIIWSRGAKPTVVVASALAVVLATVQIANVVPTLTTSEESVASRDADPFISAPLYVTQEGLYTVSPKQNVIVFVLDTFDTTLMEEILTLNPAALDSFEGFTYYRNSAGSMVPTPYAIPFMLTGRFPKPNEALTTYTQELYDEGSFIRTAHDLGYSLGLYSDSTGLDFNKSFDRMLAADTLNIHPLTHASLNVWNAFAVLDQCALYYSAPWVAKPLFCYSDIDVDNRLIAQTEGARGSEALYEYDDATFLATLKENGLAEDDGEDGNENGSEGAFRFIHLLGPHFPYNLDEEGNFIGINESSILRQAQGSLKVVEYYLDELKRMELYDSTTIIVTADHGIWDEREDPLETPASPLLLVKMASNAETDADARGGEGVPGAASDPTSLRISDAPVSQEDLLPTLIAAMGGSSQQISQYGSGLTFDQVSEGERIRRHLALTNDVLHGRRLIEYVIQGDVLDLNNWMPTGNIWSNA